MIFAICNFGDFFAVLVGLLKFSLFGGLSFWSGWLPS